MQQAVIHNKLDSLLRNNFKVSEDVLASSIIGTLLMLPTVMFWQILKEATLESDLPKFPGELLDYEFWPHWPANETNNIRFIEPDVFLRFENLDLIIEAKRYDQHQQSKEQWTKEIKAYYNEYSDAKKQVILLAIGGINTNKTEIVKAKKNEVNIHKLKWQSLFYASYRLEKEVEDNSNTKRILQILLQSFELSGFIKTSWFMDFYFNKKITLDSKEWNPNYLSSFENIHYNINQNIIREWKIQVN